MGYMCLFQFWFPKGICLGVGFLDHRVVFTMVSDLEMLLFSVRINEPPMDLVHRALFTRLYKY